MRIWVRAPQSIAGTAAVGDSARLLIPGKLPRPPSACWNCGGNARPVKAPPAANRRLRLRSSSGVYRRTSISPIVNDGSIVGMTRGGSFAVMPTVRNSRSLPPKARVIPTSTSQPFGWLDARRGRVSYRAATDTE